MKIYKSFEKHNMCGDTEYHFELDVRMNKQEFEQHTDLRDQLVKLGFTLNEIQHSKQRRDNKR